MPFTQQAYAQHVHDLARSVRDITSPLYVNAIIDEFNENISDLDLTAPEDLGSYLDQLPEQSGIYLFMARFDGFEVPEGKVLSSHFLDVWRELRGDGYMRPNANKGVCVANLAEPTEVWFPFYLGIEKNLQRRLTQHILEPSAKSTYALRLTRNAEKLHGIRFGVTYFEVPLALGSYLVVELYEQVLRAHLNPLVGRGRRLGQEQ